MRKEEEAYKEALDVEDSYRLARRLERYKTNPDLGYRTAGSEAELLTGDLIFEEMKAMGLSNVRKEKIRLDSWDFKTAVLCYQDGEGREQRCLLGAYQTDFHTRGFEEFSMVYVGKGTAKDYEGLDVTGKLVLAEMNQREEWWINFPVYQAYVRGAAALIAVQEGGFGEVDETALNAQDIGGPAQAPAFSMSRADAKPLKQLLAQQGECPVRFLADSTVRKDAFSYNLVGELPGKDPDSMILLSAHYDSYFSGFQDDNAAVALMLGIGKALIKSGFQPEKTLVFCALAAEEWGIADSKYDWSTGAWQQITAVHPEWAGKTVADINFELPAHAHGKKDGIRTIYEYVDFLTDFVKELPVPPEAYPEGIEIYAPIQTMSDDFSMAIGGIPSMVNDFTSGQFMETHYHSQFDNEDYYEEPVYRFHHELYGRLVMAWDRTAAAPLNFGRLFRAISDSVRLDFDQKTGARGRFLKELSETAAMLGEKIYSRIKEKNAAYSALLLEGRRTEAESLRGLCLSAEKLLLQTFKKEQDSFVRLNWHDEVLFPHEAVRLNLSHLDRAVECLESGQLYRALESIYQIDNNRYAFEFDQEVFDHFTDYVMNQESDRLQWGAGRIIHHENLFGLVQELKAKAKEKRTDCALELKQLKQVRENQLACYVDDIEYMIHAIEKIMQSLKMIEEVLYYG